MDAYVEYIHQYEAKEQAELRVRINVPGKWFPGLTPAEKKEDYEAEAIDWDPSHKFPKRGERKEMRCTAIKFLCKSDVFEDASHAVRLCARGSLDLVSSWVTAARYDLRFHIA